MSGMSVMKAMFLCLSVAHGMQQKQLSAFVGNIEAAAEKAAEKKAAATTSNADGGPVIEGSTFNGYTVADTLGQTCSTMGSAAYQYGDITSEEMCRVQVCPGILADPKLAAFSWKVYETYSRDDLPYGCGESYEYQMTGMGDEGTCFWNSKHGSVPAMTTTSASFVLCGKLCPDVDACAIYADPHISGFDNFDDEGPAHLSLARTATATFNGRRPMDIIQDSVGLFWLVRSGTVHVQGRFIASQDFKPDKAAMGSMFIGGPFVQGHSLIVHALDGIISWHGQTLAGNYSDAIGNIEQTKRADAVDSVYATLPQGVKLNIDRFRHHIDAKITMPRDESPRDGLCGNSNGASEDDTEAAIAERMGSLRVQAGEAIDSDSRGA